MASKTSRSPLFPWADPTELNETDLARFRREMHEQLHPTAGRLAGGGRLADKLAVMRQAGLVAPRSPTPSTEGRARGAVALGVLGTGLTGGQFALVVISASVVGIGIGALWKWWHRKMQKK